MPVINNVYNQKNTPALWSSIFADFPPAGYVGRLLIATDTQALYRDNGTSFDLIGGPGTGTITGSGTPGTVVKFTGAGVIGDSIITESGGAIVVAGSVTGNSIIKAGGTSNQFLKADGSTDSNTYITGNQNILLTGDISGSGTTSISTTIGAGVIDNTMLSGIASNINSGVVLLANGSGGFTKNDGLNFDGTFFSAANFLTSGKFVVDGSSGGDNNIFFDGSNTFLLRSDFDNITIQAGVNDANKRQINFDIGNTNAAYIDISGDTYRATSLNLSDDSKKFATTEFVKGQGYVTSSGVTSVAAGTGISVTGTTSVTVTNTGTLQTTTNNGNTTTNGIVSNVSSASDALQINKTGSGYAVNVASGISNFTYTVAMSTASQFALISNLIFSGANDTNTTQAVYGGLLGQMAFNGTGAATFNSKTIAAGVIGKSYFGITGGSYNKAAGIGGSLEFKDNVNVTTAATIFALSPYVTASNTYTGTITNYCGIYLDDVKGQTDIPGAGITNSWGIYQAGVNDSNYLNGKTLIGTSNSAGTMKLQVSGDTYFSGQQFEGSYVLRSSLYKSLGSNVADTFATITGSNTNLGLHRVIVEYAALKNNAGTLTYQSGRLTAFFRIGVGTLGLSSTDILDTSFITFNYSLSGSVLTLTANPGAASNSFVMVMQITVITDGSGTGLTIS